MTEKLTIGGLEISVEDARKLARPYMNGPGLWSYPAYDSYPGNGDPDSVGPQDVLAAGLLNAGQNPLTTMRTFGTLFEAINTGLPHIPKAVTLDTADEAARGAIADLFGVLDRSTPTPAVRLTKLSKVLHLKRPGLIPLFDDHIWRAYSKLGDIRVEPVKGRSWKDYSVVWLREVQKDLCEGMQHWTQITGLAPAGGPVVTPLRALDMVAWRLVDRDYPKPRKRRRLKT